VHQIFVSYATEDQEAASRVCAMLEADGVDCWLASRDAAEQKDRAAEILQAIRRSDLVLLVFSGSANTSPDVLHEIERAVAFERPVLPVRVDDAVPSAALQHYLDLASGSVAVASAGTAGEPESEPSVAEAKARRPRRTVLALAISLAAVVAVAGLGLGLGLERGLDRGANLRQGAWTNLEPAEPLPAARCAQAMAYEPLSRRLIMFGGTNDATGDLDDIWAYDPTASTWSELKPSGPVPSARSVSTWVYVSNAKQLILCGGVNEAGLLDDTWAYDPAAGTWTELKPSGTLPAARAWAASAYDSDTGKLIMFGGGAGAFDANTITADFQLNDTWAYDPVANSWTELKPSGAIPSGRYASMMAYDPSSRKMILFGGMTPAARLNDTWAYNPATNTWTELSPVGATPSPRGGHAMAYEPVRGRMIMFGGGESYTDMVNDTWAYDPAANSWVELTPMGKLPWPRGAHSMVYDPVTQRLIMFGGVDDTRTYLHETWAFAP
jgi:N-acetylneuraminic acid mutarotase